MDWHNLYIVHISFVDELFDDQKKVMVMLL